MNKTPIILIILAVLVILEFLYLKDVPKTTLPTDDNNSTTVSNEVDTAIRTSVTTFSQKLKNVSLLSPTVKADLATEYGDLVTPELLSEWQAKPSEALGRQTSSPWPDSINIVEVREVSPSEYRVEANIIEVSSAEPKEPLAVLPVSLTLVLRDGEWLISDVAKGSYSELPQRVTVTGKWECLPHKDTSGPQTLECAFGIILDDGTGHLAVNTSLMSSIPAEPQVGKRVRIEGILTPIEQISSNLGQIYNIKGIISATTISELN